jgi:serine/threonine protein kinase
MKIFVDADYYVEVDEADDFRVTSEYAVGSAGCVVKLRAAGKAPHALKIPLLRATNLAENLQVCKLLATEWQEVSKVAGGKNLVPMVGSKSPQTLCAPLLIIPEKAERRQTSGVLLVAFANDGRPMIVNSAVLTDQNTRSKELAPLKQLLSPNVSDIAEEAPKTIFYFFKKPYAPPEGRPPELEKGVMEEKTSRPIFFNVPSITYEWKPRNLQADVSTGLLDNASYPARLQIVSLMLDAVNSLHSKNVLHCDIRPANIFRSDAAVPEGGYDRDTAEVICRDYQLGDFGSLNERSNREPDAAPIFGDSVLGPAVAPLRTSLFYAPERRIAGEFEDADHVTIVPTPQNGLCRVDLKYAKYERVSKAHDRIADKIPDIRPGDNLRVRDLVLTIKSTNADKGGGGNVTASFVCSNTVARIVHNRLSIIENLEASEDFAISGYVVIRQWSRATDMFSIGVLLLYLLFVKQARSPGSSDVKPLETMFAECLETICAKPYFESFWPRLALFTSAVLETPQNKFGELTVNEIDKQAVRITEYAKTVTNDLTASCPFLDKIFHALDGNSARFVLNVWFAMACIHRAEDLPKTKPWDGKYDRPFCKSRIETTNSGAQTQAQCAFKVLESIEGLVHPDNAALEQFALLEVTPFSLQSDYIVRLQVNAILAEITQLKSAMAELDKSIMPPLSERTRRVVQVGRDMIKLTTGWPKPDEGKKGTQTQAADPTQDASPAD